jgi:hypothetical protein
MSLKLFCNRVLTLSFFSLAVAEGHNGPGDHTRHQPRVGFARQLVSVLFETSLIICRERSQENKKAEKRACDAFAKEHPNGLGVAEV